MWNLKYCMWVFNERNGKWEEFQLDTREKTDIENSRVTGQGMEQQWGVLFILGDLKNCLQLDLFLFLAI